MTISTLLMILAFAVGPGTSHLILRDSSTPTTSASSTEEPVGQCWINGVWYNPCPNSGGGGSTPWDPEPPPDTQPLN